MKEIVVLASKGCGSAIVEAFLSLAKIKYSREELDYGHNAKDRSRLTSVNALGEVPALVLPNGDVLTETLAMAHYVHALAPEAKLIPQMSELVKFLRWSTF